jgi:hypothetical protein
MIALIPGPMNYYYPIDSYIRAGEILPTRDHETKQESEYLRKSGPSESGAEGCLVRTCLTINTSREEQAHMINA